MPSTRRKKRRKIDTTSNWRCCSAAKLCDWGTVANHINEEEAKFVDRTASTALHWACRKGAPEDIVLSLLAAFQGAAGLEDCASYKPLHYAVVNRFSDEIIFPFSDEVISRLLEASPSAALAQISDGRTALHLATNHKDVSTGVVSALIAHGKAAALQTDKAGHTPLHNALSNGLSDDVVLLLLEAAPSAAAMPNKRGNTPLHRACMKGRSKRVVMSLLVCFQGVKATGFVNDAGYTPLHYASIYSQDDIILLLLEALSSWSSIASFQTKDTQETALHMAMFTQGEYRGETFVSLGTSRRRERRHGSLLPRKKLLESYSESETLQGNPRSMAVLRGLVEACPDSVLARDVRGRTSLHHYFMRRHRNDCDFLIQSLSRDIPTLRDQTSAMANQLEEKAFLFFGAFYKSLHGSSVPDARAWVHAAIRIDSRRQSWLKFFLLRHPGDAEVTDSNGNNLLHAGAGLKTAKKSSLAIRLVLERQPRLAGVPNHRGRLPLMNRVDAIKKFDAVVEELIRASPSTISSRDPISGLYPFMLAAAASGSDDRAEQTPFGKRVKRKKDLAHVILVYTLLRRNPSLVCVGSF